MINWPHENAVARRKLGVPAEWTIYSLEILDDGNYLAKGAIEGTTVAGKKKWMGREKVATIAPAELREERMRYERTTGKCHYCLGEGKVAAKWERDVGTTYATCKRCLGTGQAKEVTP